MHSGLPNLVWCEEDAEVVITTVEEVAAAAAFVLSKAFFSMFLGPVDVGGACREAAASGMEGTSGSRLTISVSGAEKRRTQCGDQSLDSCVLTRSIESCRNASRLTENHPSTGCQWLRLDCFAVTY